MGLMVDRSGDRASVYGIVGDQAIDLSVKDPAIGADLGGVIDAGVDGLTRAAGLLSDAHGPQPSKSLTLALPLRSSGKIICLGLNDVDHARTPPLWTKAGDVVEVEIEGIGILRNPILDEVDHDEVDR